MTAEEDGARLAMHIGGRLRAIREEKGVSSATAAEAIGLSVQAYLNRETGDTELKAFEVVILSDLLEIAPRDIFEGADAVWPGPTDEQPPHEPENAVVLADEAEEFLRLLARIRDPKLRHDVAEAIRALARATAETH